MTVMMSVAVAMVVGLVLAMIMVVMLSMTVSMVGFVLMGRCPVPVMCHLRPYIGLLIDRGLGHAPATTFQMETGCGEQLLQRRRVTLRTVPQGLRSNFLQSVKGVATGLALVIEYGHSA